MSILQTILPATSDPAAAEHSIAIVEYSRLPRSYSKDWLRRIDRCRIVLARFDDTWLGRLAISNLDCARRASYRPICQPVAVDGFDMRRGQILTVPQAGFLVDLGPSSHGTTRGRS